MIRSLTLRAATLAAALALAPATSGGGDPAAGAGSAPQVGDELGRRIYRDGLLAPNEPVRATVAGDVALDGTQATCRSCHGRSGFGAAEGGKLVPAITAAALFRPSGADRLDPRGPQPPNALTRPAYTEPSLARAIRKGISPTGRRLDALMPRYAIDDANMVHLIAYLRSLAARAPGVSDASIRFATVATEGVDPSERRAMLDVLDAYLRVKNAETRGETARKQRGAWLDAAMFRSYRRWELDVWELSGPPDTWPTQLERHLREAPVFALVSGLAAGEWRPIHVFCEAHELPCLFPNTDLPPESDGDFYSLYFSRGVRLEADVLAHYLDETGEGRQPVIQVFRDGPGHAAALRFRDALASRGSRTRDHAVPADRVLEPDFLAQLALRERPSVLVLWLGDSDVAALTGAIPTGTHVYLSSTLVRAGADSVPASLREGVEFVHSFALPADAAKSLSPIRTWLRQRGLDSRADRVQANTYVALTLLRRALQHIMGNFSQDYLIETIEHQVETAHSTSVYPRLGLGPGQRFASNGGYVVRIAEVPQAGLTPLTGWIVP